MPEPSPHIASTVAAAPPDGRAADGPLAIDPLDTLWKAPAIAFAVVAGEGLALVLALAPGADGDRWVYFGLASLLIQWITLLTLATLFALRRPLARLSPIRVAQTALGLLLAWTWLLGGGAAYMLRHRWSAAGDWLPVLGQLTVIALAVGLLGLVAFQNYWRARQLAVRAKQSELAALHARIRPHFLFNTLNTATALVHDRPGDAEHVLLDLADLFRAALTGPREVPLADELALAHRYLKIEALRFGARLRVHWDLPATLPAVMVPTLSIQPLAENAVRHGVEPSATTTDIEIRVQVDAQVVRVIVGNTLPHAGSATATGHRVGLIATRDRIHALAHGRGRLDTRIEDGRYLAIITLPLAAVAGDAAS